MILMVEDMNSELPLLNEGSTKLLLEKTGQYVRKNHTSRRWPTINIFVKGIKHYREWATAEYTQALPETPKDDSVLSFGDRITIKRVKSGEPISDHLLNPLSPQRQFLVANSDLQDSDFHKYVASKY